MTLNLTMLSQPADDQPLGVETLISDHIDDIDSALDSLRDAVPTLARWSASLALRLAHGQRLLVAGNGGSAAEAQHLTAELVGRFDGEREPFSALSLHAETSSLTAIGNDYGFEHAFARQVAAHGRPLDILMVLSTSGGSPNLLRAIEAARKRHITTWAVTGGQRSPIALAADEAIVLRGKNPSIQEAQLVAIHALCRGFDHCVAGIESVPWRA
jgi:D-sedoheptulose 7-phosphate isomerase